MSPMAKPRPRSRSSACTPAPASRPKAEPPDSTTASMRSAVRCGSSRSVSRVAGAPPRTSTATVAGSAKTIAVTPEARRASSACPTRTPATSVMRLRGAMRPRRSGAGAVSVAGSPALHIMGSGAVAACASARWAAFRRMAADVTIFAALLAGIVSFLSPCVLPLVPPYLVYLAGTSLERLADQEPPPRVKRDTVVAALLFVAGFSTVFVALGASASAIGALIRFYSSELAIVAGVVIIAMGLHFLGLTRINFLYRQARIEMPKPVGLWGAYVMGLAFALGWTPCIGPILAAILAVAASKATVAKGAGLLAVYSLGLGVPFIIAALAVEPFAAFLTRFRTHLAHVERVMGGLLVLTGIAFLAGFFTQLNSWLIEAFPALQNIG